MGTRMKTMIVTTPIRDEPTTFPPFGSLTLIKYMRKHGNEAAFYDIDYNRPTLEEAVDHIAAYNPDILGISAVVSTAYAFVKALSTAIRKRLPDTLIVVGGNMGASSEILLRKAGVDLCVLGEGEVIFNNVVERAKTTTDLADYADIKGLMSLDGAGGLVNTGYEAQLPASELYDIDWDDLESTSDASHFFPRMDDNPWMAMVNFNKDPRILEPHRRGKTKGMLYSSKGCVARCTFCHRWDKGIRAIPLDLVMQRLEEMIERYNVGFVSFADENFGADRRWLKEFCERVSKYDILWTAGMRAKGVDEDLVEMVRASGCNYLGFGIESGSPKILSVMEKKTKLDDNLKAIKITHEAGIPSPIALVIGMPGESPETIGETIELCKYAKGKLPWINPNNLSINYAQALPGTPLYEFARHKGLIGQTLDAEEDYLMAISGRDAHDEFTTLNFTDFPTITAQSWRPRITVETNQHFVDTFGLDQYLKVVLGEYEAGQAGSESKGYDSGYFANPMRLQETSGTAQSSARAIDYDRMPVPSRPSLMKLIGSGKLGLALIVYPEVAYKLRHFLPLLVIYKDLRNFGVGYTARLIGEYFGHHLKRLIKGEKLPAIERSLRKIVDQDLGSLATDDPAMLPLRKGR